MCFKQEMKDLIEKDPVNVFDMFSLTLWQAPFA